MNENQKPVNDNYRNNWDEIFKRAKQQERKEQKEREPNDIRHA